MNIINNFLCLLSIAELYTLQSFCELNDSSKKILFFWVINCLHRFDWGQCKCDRLSFWKVFNKETHFFKPHLQWKPIAWENRSHWCGPNFLLVARCGLKIFCSFFRHAWLVWLDLLLEFDWEKIENSLISCDQIYDRNLNVLNICKVYAHRHLLAIMLFSF